MLRFLCNIQYFFTSLTIWRQLTFDEPTTSVLTLTRFSFAGDCLATTQSAAFNVSKSANFLSTSSTYTQHLPTEPYTCRLTYKTINIPADQSTFNRACLSDRYDRDINSRLKAPTIVVQQSSANSWSWSLCWHWSVRHQCALITLQSVAANTRQCNWLKSTQNAERQILKFCYQHIANGSQSNIPDYTNSLTFAELIDISSFPEKC